MNGKYRLGQLVSVRQQGPIWHSRILGWSDYHQCPIIATAADRNPCHAEWPYFEESLVEFNGPDWATSSKYAPGQEIQFDWVSLGNLHYPDGTLLTAQIEVAHIEPGDWYVSFPVPDGWLFEIVVNEKEFVGPEQRMIPEAESVFDAILAD